MNDLATALNLALALLVQAQKISVIVATATSEGRTTLTTEEKATIKAERDAAFAKLDESIARAESEGR